MNYSMANIVNILPKHPTRKWKLRPTPTRIVVHTTASDNQDPYKTARYHVHAGKTNHISKKGCPAIVYHDLITKEGLVYHCNYYADRTWHAGGYNKSSIGVGMCFRGQDYGVRPTLLQFETLRKHLVKLCLYFKILPKRIVGHREVPGMWTLLGNGSKRYKKTCPGMSVDLDELRSEIAVRMQRVLSSVGLYEGAIDGLFGRKSKKALKAHQEERLRGI